MKKTFVLLLTIVSILLFTSCGDVSTKEPTIDITPPQTEIEEGYTLSFNIMGHGSAQASIDNIKSIPSALPTLSAEGYEFDGWYLDKGCTKKVELGSKLIQDTTLYAKWTKIEETETPVTPTPIPPVTEEPVTPEPTPTPVVVKYIVTFNSNGGSIVASVEVEENKKITAPTNPTKEGYTFVGWFSDEVLTKAWKFDNDVVTANTTLYAKWKEEGAPVEKYDVTYNANGHGTQPAEVTDVLALPAELPLLTEDGYNFLGWYTDETLTVKAVAGSVIKNDTVLYAKWEKVAEEVVKTDFFMALQYEEYVDESITDVDGIYKIIFNSDEVDVTGEKYYNLNTNITLNQGYTIIWYADKDNYSSQLVTQRAHLEYGNNIYYATITNMNGQFLASYAFNIYVLHDYYFNYYEFQYGYKLANQHKPYYTERVIEGECTSLYKGTENGFNFKGWLTLDFQTRELVKYDFTQPTYRNVEFFASYEDVEITLNNQKNNFSPFLTDKLDINVPSTIDNLYDGWYYNDVQYINEDNEIVSSISNHQIINKLSIEYVNETQNKYFKFTEVEDGYCIDLVKTPSYTDILIIPSEYNSKPVLTLGRTSFNNKAFRYIFIPNAVITLEKGTFSGCNNLESMTTPFVGESINGESNTYFGYIFGDIIPTTLKEVVITSCTSIGGYAFKGCSSLTSIKIPNSVTSIGEYAFYNCSSLTSITIPNSVTSIGSGAFEYCNRLKSVVISDSVKIIEAYAFECCSSLASVYYNGKIEDWCNIKFPRGSNILVASNPMCYADNFYILDSDGDIEYNENKYSLLTKLLIPNTVTSIGDYAFYNCRNLTSVTIPDSVTSIGSGAFECCNSLKSVVIGDSVTSINSSIFSGCNSLESVVIGNSVTRIGASTFSGFSNLKSLVIGASVTSIGKDAFYNCINLTSVYYTGKIEDWCNIEFSTTGWVLEVSNPMRYADYFYILDNDGNIEYNGNKYSLLTKLIIPNIVTSIEDYAFFCCSSLTSIEIPNSVTSIGDYAFYGCSSLESVVIGNSVTSIGNDAFCGCSSLTSITFEENSQLAIINSSAFYNCSSLTSIEIPNSVTSIGEDAFYGCSSLESVVIGNSVTSIGNDAFSGCSSLTSITFEENSQLAIVWSSAFRGCSSLTSIEIPDSVTSICSNVFSGCSSLESITIPNSVTFIAYEIFSGCGNLTSISLPFIPGDTLGTIFGKESYEGAVKTVQYYKKYNNSDYYYEEIFFIPSSLISVNITGETIIEPYAFYNCGNLISVGIGDSVTSIGNYAFYNCDSLTSVVIGNSVEEIGYSAFRYCSSLTNIEIPNSVASIGDYAFYCCSKLTGVEIPEGVTSIGNYAFNYCDSLGTVIIGNSVESIGIYAFEDCYSLTSIVIGEALTNIGDNAFWGCFSLVEIVNKSSLEIESGSQKNGRIANYAKQVITDEADSKLKKDGNGFVFYEDGTEELLIRYNGEKEEVTIPEIVTKINEHTFYNCGSLKSIEIPDSVTNIGDRAFNNCSNLTNIYYNGTIEQWINIAFVSNPMAFAENFYILDSNGNVGYNDKEYRLLDELIIPDTVSIINNHVFSGFDNLTSVVIGNSVEEIGEDAFYNCKNLTSIEIPPSVKYIKRAAFSGCSGLTSVEIPESVITIADSAFSGCSSLTSVEIPSSVTRILDYSFSGCSSLTSVKIPSSVTRILDYSFSGCSSLTSIEIPSSVTYIDEYAFSYCSSLINIIVDENNEVYDSRNNCNAIIETSKNTILIGCQTTIIPNTIKSIGKSSFSWCESLTSIEIPNSVISIGDYAFANCDSLTSIVIPSTVTSIGESAFVNCDNITNVYYNGTIEDWCNISFGSRNVPLTSATRYYYSETKPTTSGNYWYYDANGNPVVW